MASGLFCDKEAASPDSRAGEQVLAQRRWMNTPSPTARKNRLEKPVPPSARMPACGDILAMRRVSLQRDDGA